MKKLLLTAASVNLALFLVACGPDPNTAKPNPSATPVPSATPSPAVSATPAPVSTPVPAGTPAPISTPMPDPNADAQVTSASAMLDRSNFHYKFSLTGSGLGSLDNYQFLQVKMGPSTIPLVVDGASKVNNVQLFNLTIAETMIGFESVLDQGAPTSGDEIEVTFERKNDPRGRRSSKVRLTVTG
ncbi:MAG: hypothetical protein AB7I41_00955 [Candidatus Sericytochromatia bacterium]